MEYEVIKNCELVKIQEKGHPFDGVKSEVLKEIIELYYIGDLSVAKIIDKFGLSIDNASKFSTYLPFFYTERKCPYDDLHLIAKLPSKSSLKNFFPDYQCEKCNHIECAKGNKVCSCNNCQSKKENDKKKLSAIIYDIYLDREVEFQDINVYDRINIATLLQVTNLEFNCLVPQYKTYKSSVNGFTMDTLRDLIDKDILKVSDQTPIEVFSKITDTSFSYIVDETLFKLNIVGNCYSGKEIFERLKYLEDINVVNTREYIRLWTEYVIHELLKIFKFEMKKLGFSRELDVEEKEKMFCNALAGWLELYSPSQVYALLYKSIRDADNARTTGTIGNYRYHEIKYIIVLVDKMIIKYEQEGWEIKNYDYPSQLEIDIQTKLFFMKVIKEKNWFGTIIPDWNQVTFEKYSTTNTVVTNYSEYIDKLECQRMDDDIEITLRMARYYYFMPHGLVIDDGNMECLFATSKDLVGYLAFLKESGRVKAEDLGERVETQISRASHFYVNRSYSSNLIYYIIKTVIKKRIPTIDEWKKDGN
ncbi:hypothetical protein IT97_07045 [Listeria monocytogenes]|uniref:hypothetical protein n=1 Tax=Listeria monocytogenes TaxID=1639 RepID=UPI0010BB6A3D|nr:hypothetical protein [Listeria monocytogenes]EAC4530825.1 hypothetical protein [Listeria monocytogenes]EAC5197128.1 hypothetical protein [Listeria monocytogenes]EAC8433483.1 hypothetical protein [Listeria monocytogenes]EAD3875510.1 hypothetical protein [Listeria monocytogenes]EAE6298284.1 hypothetical protein [Listeria monocytogenes]